MKPASQAVIDAVLSFIRRHPDEMSTSAACDAEFQDLALQLFRYQFEHNLAYRKYCQARRKTPHNVRHWLEIPPVPIQAFKEVTLSCEPPETAQAVFMTSGTTRPDQRGRNYHPTLAVWDESMTTGFRAFVLPDGGRMTMFVLSPGEEEMPNSSLARYLSQAVRCFGSDRSRFFWQDGRLDTEALIAALRRCQAEGEPVLLLGATFAYVHAAEVFAQRGLTFQLPSGSRVFDTGGMKGRGRELTREEFAKMITSVFGVPAEQCINMYGMTELSSQLYDQTIRSGGAVRDKTGPAWIRTVVLHPDTLQPLPGGETGILAHYDLANWNAAVAILTEDLGVQTRDGFILLGRAQGSEARGCSIAIDELLRANTSGGARG